MGPPAIRLQPTTTGALSVPLSQHQSVLRQIGQGSCGPAFRYVYDSDGEDLDDRVDWVSVMAIPYGYGIG